ncbi:translation elongation factor 2 (EF-2/EF-G) [Candidatus Koribacter versatilis Ellin345]|uniref:Elongation factor G n=1 Tax=Koribacter versatilis (strain Ellin345) TaxID=204669 RepID=Q1IH98_KORVE|nr:elongation factor G [Candidatus Koribacter versatilis]ABF43752.1 translation elongation factor 2 (EF-2/EF-G) [Candidatus Koribacter versatilis Ellin345]
MKSYEGANIRNVALVGHSHSGKTSLASAMLYTAGATPKLLRVDEGNTVTDYEEEEVARLMTLSAAPAYCEWHNCKINLIDTPGFNLFIHEAEMILPVVDAAMVVVDAVSGVQVVTQKIWQYCEDLAMPRTVVCTRMDRERADFTRVMDSLTAAFGRTVVPVQLPVGAEKSFTGVIDLVKMKAYTYDMGGNGRAKVGEIPANMAEEAKAAHERLVELVAEGDDVLMEEFFSTGTIGEEHIVSGIHNAIRDDKIFPVLFASGLGNMGTDEVLDFIADYMPTAVEKKTVKGEATPNNGAPPERKIADSEPASAYVFKTVNDPFAGRISLFKVFSGVVKNDATLQNFTRNSSEKLAHISAIQGKALTQVNDLHAGDIGAVAKLRETLTGDTLGDKAAPIQYPMVKFAEPAITYAIEPKTRADEDKLSNGIHKMMEEDALLRFFRDPQTKEFLVAGTGQQHIEVVVSKLKKRYHTEVILKAPKVPYRETIRGKADVQGRHKKQSGGHGQFGDCKIKMEPLPRGGNFEFVNDIFGGSIPKNFIPAVEKGIVEAAARGYLAGFPVVDFRVILYDGSYHDVDSNEMSFKTAGRIAFRKAMETAKPTLLEPIMNVEITAPDEFAGGIMGDLNSRRGRIQGMDNKAGSTVVKAEVPMAEMLTYGTDLTSMTQGRGSFTMEMNHYDIVPSAIQEKVVAQAKAERGEVVEEEE